MFDVATFLYDSGFVRILILILLYFQFCYFVKHFLIKLLLLIGKNCYFSIIEL